MVGDPYRYFRIEAAQLVEALAAGALAAEAAADASGSVGQLLRHAHTLKGAARVVRLAVVAERAHAIEDVLDGARDVKAALPAGAADRVLALVDEIRAQLAALPAAVAATAPPNTGTAAPEHAAPPAPSDATAASVGPDSVDLDALIEGVGEAQARALGLGRAATAATRARGILARLEAQLGGALGRDAERARARLGELSDELAIIERTSTDTAEQLDRELRRVRDAAEQLRLIPAQTLFLAVQQTARNDARALGKSVVFEARGGAVRLAAPAVGALQDALIQLVRNAIVHGIEPSSERVHHHKPPEGRVTVEVARRGARVALVCSDDGRGVDVVKVRAKLGAAAAALAPEGVLRALVGSGVSTSPGVSELAGRGLGLDVARDVAARLGGTLEIRTTPGQGTVVELVVPAALASLDALWVRAGSVTAVIPAEAVKHTLRATPADITRSPHGDTLLVGDDALPFAHLLDLLGTSTSADAAMSVVIVRHGDRAVAIGVDRVLAVSRVIARPLPELARAHAAVAGATLDGAGVPQIVLDPDALVALVPRVRRSAAQPAAAIAVLVVDDSLTTRMLEQSILESAGYQVDLASSGEEGLERARERSYALYLVDVEMPGIDGFTFVERTRAQPATAAVPAILVTSRGSAEDRQRGRDAGAADYFVKSEFDQGRLLDRIRELVR